MNDYHKLMNISITSINCLFILWNGNTKDVLFYRFQVCNTLLLAIVTMLYITSPELIHLLLLLLLCWVFIPWPGIEPGPPAVKAWTPWSAKEVQNKFILKLEVCTQWPTSFHFSHHLELPFSSVFLWLQPFFFRFHIQVRSYSIYLSYLTYLT